MAVDLKEKENFLLLKKRDIELVLGEDAAQKLVESFCHKHDMERIDVFVEQFHLSSLEKIAQNGARLADIEWKVKLYKQLSTISTVVAVTFAISLIAAVAAAAIYLG